MAVEVSHNFSSPIPDALDPTIVKPSHWNQLHTIRALGPAVLGLPGAGQGTVVEITPVGATPLALLWTGGNITWGTPVTAIAPGTILTVHLADDAVTFAKFQNINTDRLLGRDTAGAGDVEEIALDSTLEFTGSQVVRRAALTGDVTASAGSNATTIANAAVTYAKIQNATALSVLGRAVNSAGVLADIVAGSDGQVLLRSGAAIAFAFISTGNILDDQITYAKMQNVSASRLLGNPTGGAADPSEISLGATLAFNGTSIEVPNDAITFSKIQNIATDRLIGRDTAGSGDPEEIPVTNGLEFTGGPGLGIANDGVTFARMQNITSDRLIGRDTAASGDPEEIALDSTLEFTGGQAIRRAALTGAIAAAAGSNATTTSMDIVVTIGDGTNVITTGTKGYLPLRQAGTITGWSLIADVSGSVVVDVWKDTWANAPPTNADSIAGSEKPTLSAVQKNQDLSLSTWTTSLSVGDVLGFEIESASTVKQITLTIHVTKNG